MGRLHRVHLAVQVLVVQLILTLILAGAGMTAVWIGATGAANEQALAVARRAADETAHNTEVQSALQGPDPVAGLRRPVDRIRTSNGVRFVTVTDTNGIRLAHPDDSKVGKRFIGNISAALRGESTEEWVDGTYGRVAQVNRPVLSPEGEVIAVVSAGQVQASVTANALTMSSTGLQIIGAAGAVGVALALLWGRRVNRQTFSMGPADISRLWQYHDALLTSVTQGMILFDDAGRIRLINRAARELLGWAQDGQDPRYLNDLGLDEEMGRILQSGQPFSGLFVVREKVLAVHQTAAQLLGKQGWVTIFQDSTELVDLSHSLTAERATADLLRARVHDADNVLHTVVSLMELGEISKASALVTENTGVAQQQVDRITRLITDPALAAIVLTKSRLATQRKVTLNLTCHDVVPPLGLPDESLVVIIGNILDNAIDAAAKATHPRWVELQVDHDDEAVEFLISDSGSGVDSADRASIFTRGWTTKKQDETQPHGFGLALSTAAVSRLQGTLELAESDDGRASNQFRVWIPRTRLECPLKEEEYAGHQSTGRRR